MRENRWHTILALLPAFIQRAGSFFGNDIRCVNRFFIAIMVNMKQCSLIEIESGIMYQTCCFQYADEKRIFYGIH